MVSLASFPGEQQGWCLQRKKMTALSMLGLRCQWAIKGELSRSSGYMDLELMRVVKRQLGVIR